jgi:hypothetical protein
MAGILDDGKRVAKIYFNRGSEALVKDMAASVRNQRSHAHLVDQRHFTGPDTVLPTNAVLVQASAPNARLIARTYAQCGLPGTEVLFFDDAGKITQLDMVAPEQSFASILGGNTETDNARHENGTERETSELLGQETSADCAEATEGSRLADIEGGNTA